MRTDRVIPFARQAVEDPKVRAAAVDLFRQVEGLAHRKRRRVVTRVVLALVAAGAAIAAAAATRSTG
jgi:hypothetical protein